jgi:glucose/arabinose dehydrogenase
LGVLALTNLLAGCPGGTDTGGTTSNPGAHPSIALRLDTVIGQGQGLSFPVFATAPRDDPSPIPRLFILEKNSGVIKILRLDTRQLLATPFLTVTDMSPAGEQGLLGLAFHPDYATNGFFYVYVNNATGDSEIRRYTVSPNLNVANTASTLVIRVSQLMPDGMTRFSNHKGGWIGFGPDGFLYVALGDGGGGGDTFNNAQNVDRLWGKMLRLNVDLDAFPADPNANYAIPPGNPFASTAGADEIWAFGLRNPWRASFDRGTGDLYIADVGQGAREEVNVSTAASGGGNGVNYGWKIMEGTNCFFPPCNVPGLTPPVLDYDSGPGPACSVTGGYVYRGTVIPTLPGTYFYGDYCAGFVRSFRFVNGMGATEQTEWFTSAPNNENITSFGEDKAGELYIVTQQGGLYRIIQN